MNSFQATVSLFSMSNIIEESEDYVFNTTDCKCFPNCDHIQYHASIYTDHVGGQEQNHSYIEVDVFFQEETLFSYRSTLYITFLDLIGMFSVYLPSILSSLIVNTFSLFFL